MIDKSLAQVSGLYFGSITIPPAIPSDTIRNWCQIGSALVVIGFTIWRWNKDRKNK